MRGDPVKGYEKWLTDQLGDLHKTRVDIRKFLFTVASGSIGIFVTLSKTAGNLLDCIDWISISAFIITALIGIYVFIPRPLKLKDGDEYQDVQKLHGKSSRNLFYSIWA